MRARLVSILAATAAACDGDAPPECVPVAGGPYALVEGEPVTATLACATDGEVRAGAAFTIATLPAGASYDPATATLRWTPGLDQAAVYELALGVTGETATGALRIAVADAFDTPGNTPPVDPLRYPEELGLPVLFLTPLPTSEEYAPATVTYRGHAFAAEAKLRGASSLGYPKNSYTIKFAAGDHFDEPDRAGGFLDKKRIVLTSTFDDNSYVRQRLAYEVWNRMDPDHVPVQAYSAVVYADGAFHGLYTLTDHVDHNLFAAHGLADAGNVYKAYNHDANFTHLTYDGPPKQTLHDGYTKKDGLPLEGAPDAFADLDALVGFVADAPPTQFATELDQRIHVADFRDWWIFATYLLGSDSGGKNCYLFHDPAAGGAFGGAWRYVPWDFNHSFGQAWETSRTGAGDFDDFRDMNQLFVRLLDEPTLGPTVAARYRALLAGPLSDAAVLALFDAMVAETAAVGARDWRKWGAAYRAYDTWRDRDDFLDREGEVAYTRQWIIDRGVYLRSRFAD